MLHHKILQSNDGYFSPSLTSLQLYYCYVTTIVGVSQLHQCNGYLNGTRWLRRCSLSVFMLFPLLLFWGHFSVSLSYANVYVWNYNCHIHVYMFDYTSCSKKKNLLPSTSSPICSPVRALMLISPLAPWKLVLSIHFPLIVLFLLRESSYFYLYIHLECLITSYIFQVLS